MQMLMPVQTCGNSEIHVFSTMEISSVRPVVCAPHYYPFGGLYHFHVCHAVPALCTLSPVPAQCGQDYPIEAGLKALADTGMVTVNGLRSPRFKAELDHEGEWRHMDHKVKLKNFTAGVPVITWSPSSAWRHCDAQSPRRSY